jgi:ribonuclease PH
VRGQVERSPLRDSVAAVSVGIVDGEPRLDLPYEEDARAEVDMNVVATGGGRLIEIQGTGEGGTFTREQLDALTDLAMQGIEEITRIQRKALDAAGSPGTP